MGRTRQHLHFYPLPRIMPNLEPTRGPPSDEAYEKSPERQARVEVTKPDTPTRARSEGAFTPFHQSPHRRRPPLPLGSPSF